MLYDLTQGRTQKKILEQVRKNGLPLPDSIKNAPVLSPGLEFYYGAYVDLSSCRGGMGDGDIPWTSVRDYANLEGLTDEEFKRLWELVKRIDLEYLKFREKQVKTKT